MACIVDAQWVFFFNFHFCPNDQIRVKNWLFCEVVVTWTLSTFQRVDILYSRILFGVSCRCAIRFRNSYLSRGDCQVCHLNYIHIFRSGQLIFLNIIRHVLHMCNKNSEFSFCSQWEYEGRTMTFCGI